MQKMKLSQRVPAKFWAILFVIVLFGLVAALLILIPGAWGWFAGSIVYGFGLFVSGLLWMVSDIRFIVGAAVIGVPILIWSTRKFWHKQTVYVAKTPLTTIGAPALMSDVPEPLFDPNKKVEAAKE